MATLEARLTERFEPCSLIGTRALAGALSLTFVARYAVMAVGRADCDAAAAGERLARVASSMASLDRTILEMHASSVDYSRELALIIEHVENVVELVDTQVPAGDLRDILHRASRDADLQFIRCKWDRPRGCDKL